jgi:hypothetical protein
MRKRAALKPRRQEAESGIRVKLLFFNKESRCSFELHRLFA